MTPRNIVRATTSRRRAVLLSTAIGALGSSLPWFIMPAEAACVITGAGSQTALQSGDSITCIGMGNTLVRTASGVSGVTVNVGDGSPTSLNDPALAGIVFDTTSNSAIKVLGNASVAPANSDGIIVSGGGNNTITVDAGAAIGSPTVGTTALGLAGSNNNIVLIGGTVGSGAAGTAGIGIFGGSAGNQVNILSSGIVQGNGPAAIDLNGAASGNTINNAGTISNASGTAIFGSNNQDTIINSGAISSNGVSIAVDLKDGNDVFELRAGSNITGWVVGGNGADTLRLGGTANAAFDLSTFGASNQFREFEALEKTGSSTWTLNGSTTEIASMNVLAGTVEVNGSMPNIATTVSAGILSGNGAIGNITVLSGGTVLPGNLGTLTSSGNVTFNAGSTYAISVTATGQSEKILAVSAALNGGTVAVNTIAGRL